MCYVLCVMCYVLCVMLTMLRPVWRKPTLSVRVLYFVEYDFAKHNLSSATMKAINDMEFTRMTEIQARTIPILMVMLC